MPTHLLLLGALLMTVPAALPPPAGYDTTRPFTVVSRVTPEVTEPGKAPTLEVTVQNPTPAAVPFMTTERPQCFVYFYLQLKLRTPEGDVVAPLPCTILSWPGNATQLKAGGEYKKTMTLAELFPGRPWKAGAYELDVIWKPDPLRSYQDGRFALGASSQGVTSWQFTITKALTTLRIQKGDTAALPDGARLQFRAHGHKRVEPDSSPGPLIVRGSFVAPGQTTATEFSAPVYPGTSRIMHIANGYTFELVNYAYDTFMELRYFGALKKTTNPSD